MKQMVSFLVFLLFTSGCCCAQDVKGRMEMPEITKDDVILDYTGFTVSYNCETLTPKWVAYELTKEEIDGDVSRRSGYSMDLDFHGRQAMREDYSNSSWDKGHMAPAADMKWSERAMKESFYLTNVCPQNHSLNGKSWHALEKRVRSWAQQYGRVYTVCGPVYGENKYGKIGKNGVQIPDAFFKAVLVPYEESYAGVAFLMENDEISHPISQSYMTIDDLELIIGIDLFVNLAFEADKTEHQVICSIWNI